MAEAVSRVSHLLLLLLSIVINDDQVIMDVWISYVAVIFFHYGKSEYSLHTNICQVYASYKCCRTVSSHLFRLIVPTPFVMACLQFGRFAARSSQVSTLMAIIFRCLFKTSLKRSFCPLLRLLPWLSSPYIMIRGILVFYMRKTCPALRRRDVARMASTLSMLALRRTSVSETRSCHLIPMILLRWLCCTALSFRMCWRCRVYVSAE